jgi:diaminobutyrate-2-oxoglutarate transaminase
VPKRDHWLERVDVRLGHTVNEVFLKIPTAEARELYARVEEEAGKQGLHYEEDDGTVRTVPILMRPRLIRPEQEEYFHKVCLELTRAIEKLARLYVGDPRVRALLPFTEREERWLRDIWAKVARQPQTVVARLDANAEFESPDWDHSFSFFETNGVGVGGMHYAPECADIVRRLVVPAMHRYAPALVLRAQDDMRQLLLEQITMHAQAIHKRRLNTAFIQTRAHGGPTEFPFLVEYLKNHGIPAAHVDPLELHLKGENLYAGDMPVDIVYRDAEIREYIRYEEAGENVAALKTAFRRNQVVSSLAGEFDHKSTFEVLTTPELAEHFTLKQQKIFRRHVLWTRIVSERRTADPDGEEIDLLPWLRRNKDQLVLKPNRSFGGTGIVVGPHVDLASWDSALSDALKEQADSGGVVVQRYVDVPVKDFPVLGSDGGIHLEEFYVVCGFLATPRGVSILGRASKKRVVNVGQKGGLTAILVLV